MVGSRSGGWAILREIGFRDLEETSNQIIHQAIEYSVLGVFIDLAYPKDVCFGVFAEVPVQASRC